MNWIDTSDYYSNEQIQSKLFTENNINYSASYTLSQMKYAEKTMHPYPKKIIQNDAKKYLPYQNQENINLKSQESEVNCTLLGHLYSNDNDLTEYHDEKYPHYYSSISTYLTESTNCQSVHSAPADKHWDSCYLCDNKNNNNINSFHNETHNYTNLSDDYTHRKTMSDYLKYDQSLINYHPYSMPNNLYDKTPVQMLYKHEEIPDQLHSTKYNDDYNNIEDVQQTSIEINKEMFSHVGTKTFICRWKSCRLTFTDHKSFVNHIESSHVTAHLSNKEYYCYWEGCRRQFKPFNARYKLIVHLRIHNGDRPNKCTYPGCFKSFSRLENLKIHIRSHTGERPFLCQQDGCDRTFSNSSDRAKHQRTHIHIVSFFIGNFLHEKISILFVMSSGTLISHECDTKLSTSKKSIHVGPLH
ncbi:unnamed protein product [Schistosoma turkestanicum]|nr:unnamed protein product [Schistosoma turkestanicum]